MELFPRICACFQNENDENSKANWRISEKKRNTAAGDVQLQQKLEKETRKAYVGKF